MICSKCGFKNILKGFCERCGNELNPNEENASLIKLDKEELKKELIIKKDMAVEFSQQQTTKVLRHASANKKKMIIIGLVLIILSVGGFEGLKLKNIWEAQKEESQRGNSVGNLVSGWGRICKKGDWIYYQNYNDDCKLYKIKTDGSEKTKLSEDMAEDINVVDSWIYYANGSDKYKIYKIKTDGKDKSKICDDTVDCMTTIGDWIYYVNIAKSGDPDGKIYKVKIDGSKGTKINDYNSTCINITGGWIYYINNSDKGKVYKVKTDGSEDAKVSDIKVSSMNVIGNWIYYTNSDEFNKLYKVKINDSKPTRINDDNVKNINVAGDWIYYCNVDDGQKIYKIKTDGSKRSKLNDEVSENIIVAGSEIYYNDYVSNRNGRNDWNDRCFYKITTNGGEKREGPDIKEKEIVDESQKMDDANSANNIATRERKEVKNGDWIYYSNSGDGGKLYKIKEDGSGKIKIGDNVPLFMTVVGDWIYYRNTSDEDSLYRIKTDGSNSQKLHKDKPTHISVSKGYVYYVDGKDKSGIYRLKIGSKDSEKASEGQDIQYMSIVGDWIYFNNKNEGVVRMNLDGSNKSLIKIDSFDISDFNCLSIEEDWLYYAHDEIIYKYKTDGSSKSKLELSKIEEKGRNSKCSSLNVFNGWIYYSSKVLLGKDDRLYKMKIDGKNITKIDNGYVENIGVIGDWVYYTNKGDSDKYYKVKTDGTQKQLSN